MKRGSSRRLMDFPNRRSTVAMGITSLLRRGLVLGGPLDGLDDVVIPGAAAEVAFQLMPDLLFGGVRRAVEDLPGGEDHARCAEATLQTVLLPEALLDRM